MSNEDPSPNYAPTENDDDHEAHSYLHAFPITIDLSKVTDDPDY